MGAGADLGPVVEVPVGPEVDVLPGAVRSGLGEEESGAGRERQPCGKMLLPMRDRALHLAGVPLVGPDLVDPSEGTGAGARKKGDGLVGFRGAPLHHMGGRGPGGQGLPDTAALSGVLIPPKEERPVEQADVGQEETEKGSGHLRLTDRLRKGFHVLGPAPKGQTNKLDLMDIGTRRARIFHGQDSPSARSDPELGPKKRNVCLDISPR